MTSRTSRSRVGVALVLAMGLISWATIASAVTLPHLKAPDALTRNAAIAPRFDPAEPVNPEEFVLEKDVRSVHFAFDKAALRPSAMRTLEADARWLKDHAPYEVVVAGFADERGTRPYNVALAKRRAMAVKHALVMQGIQPDRITMVSYGEARPECRLKIRSDSCWSQNRRADIFVRHAANQKP